MKASLGCAAALAAALALAACTGTATAPPPTGGATLAASSPPGATTASPTPSATSAAGSESGQQVIDRMVKAMRDAKTGKGRMTTTTGGTSVTMNMEFASVSDTQMDIRATMGMSGMNLEVLLVGGALYLSGFPAAMSGGKPWVKVDPNGTDPLSRQLSGLLKDMGDPVQGTKSFAGSTATLVGREGDLSHYKLSNTGAGGDLELYLDSLDRPAKFAATVQGTQISATYSDWGAPVTIGAPPAEQVGAFATPR